MSTVNRERKIEMSRCLACDHDITATRAGKLRCTNLTCRFATEHPSKPFPMYRGARA